MWRRPGPGPTPTSPPTSAPTSTPTSAPTSAPTPAPTESGPIWGWVLGMQYNNPAIAQYCRTYGMNTGAGPGADDPTGDVQSLGFALDVDPAGTTITQITLYNSQANVSSFNDAESVANDGWIITLYSTANRFRNFQKAGDTPYQVIGNGFSNDRKEVSYAKPFTTEKPLLSIVCQDWTKSNLANLNTAWPNCSRSRGIKEKDAPANLPCERRLSLLADIFGRTSSRMYGRTSSRRSIDDIAVHHVSHAIGREGNRRTGPARMRPRPPGARSHW